jgi:hypothetical protein
MQEASGMPTDLLSKSKAATINTESSPLSIVMLYFTAVIPLVMEENNQYYHQYPDTG